MAALQSNDSFFSNFRRFTWSYSADMSGNYASISCIAASVEEARQRVLQYLEQIESLREEKLSIDKKISDLFKENGYTEACAEATLLKEQLKEKLPPIDDNLRNYHSTGLFDYSRQMKIEYDSDTTLQEFILTTDPMVKKISLVSFTSCLDG